MTTASEACGERIYKSVGIAGSSKDDSVLTGSCRTSVRLRYLPSNPAKARPSVADRIDIRRGFSLKSM